MVIMLTTIVKVASPAARRKYGIMNEGIHSTMALLPWSSMILRASTAASGATSYTRRISGMQRMSVRLTMPMTV